MHRFKLQRNLRHPFTGQAPAKSLQPGVWYVTESIQVKNYLYMDNQIHADPWKSSCSQFPPTLKKGNKVLLLRDYGVGDILFLTPLVAAIKKKYPGVEVHLGCANEWVHVFEETSGFDGIEASPFLETWLDQFQVVISFEDVVEYHPLANQVHIIDLFANHAGLTLENKRLQFVLPENEVNNFLKNHPKSDRIRVGLQLQSSSPVRNYPLKCIRELIKLGIDQGFEWVVMGTPGSGEEFVHPQIINLTTQKPAITFKESLVWINSCQGFIGPDSSLVHFAGALNIPTVALYGSFNSALRIAYEPSIVAIQQPGACAPCFHHSKPHLGPMPFSCPGLSESICKVLESIKPQQIIETLLKSWAHALCHT